MKVTLQDDHATIIAALLATSIKDQRTLRDRAQHRIDAGNQTTAPRQVTDVGIVEWCDKTIAAYETTLDAIKEVW